MPDYDFTTEWRIDAPIDDVWEQLAHPTQWPQWWHGCRQAVELAPHQEGGPRRRYRFKWRGKIPIRLLLELELTDREAPHRLAGDVEGSLVGRAVWSLNGDASQTRVGFHLMVDVGKPWMKRWVSFTQGLFHWNFHALMEEGREGLGQRLDAATAPLE